MFLVKTSVTVAEKKIVADMGKAVSMWAIENVLLKPIGEAAASTATSGFFAQVIAPISIANAVITMVNTGLEVAIMVREANKI